MKKPKRTQPESSLIFLSLYNLVESQNLLGTLFSQKKNMI
ncbi:hypothetical protein CHCC20375_1194 [Bacillus licheniformis]|nr:hypothetical protein CHCC20375_1194 [Bacillus licheniformis]